MRAQDINDPAVGDWYNEDVFRVLLRYPVETFGAEFDADGCWCAVRMKNQSLFRIPMPHTEDQPGWGDFLTALEVALKINMLFGAPDAAA